MANISTGFHRIGVVFATVPAVIGVLTIGYWAYFRITTPEGPWTKYAEPNVQLYIGLAWLLGAAVLFAAIWAVGWIIRGFSQKAV